MELENIYELMEKFRHSGLAKLELREADTLIKMEMPRKTETDQKQNYSAVLPPAAAKEPAEHFSDTAE